jgi:hypothetical protein
MARLHYTPKGLAPESIKVVAEGARFATVLMSITDVESNRLICAVCPLTQQIAIQQTRYGTRG